MAPGGIAAYQIEREAQWPELVEQVRSGRPAYLLVQIAGDAIRLPLETARALARLVSIEIRFRGVGPGAGAKGQRRLDVERLEASDKGPRIIYESLDLGAMAPGPGKRRPTGGE